MKRLPRMILNAATALSLLSCAAAVAPWVWTSASGTCVTVTYTRPLWGTFLAVAGGEFRLEHTRVFDPTYPNSHTGFGYDSGLPTWSDGGVFPDRIPGQWIHFRRGGFALVTGERWNDYHYALFLPGWFVLLLTALVPVARIATYVRTRSANSLGFCRLCGYDLRATPARCPECGTIPH